MAWAVRRLILRSRNTAAGLPVHVHVTVAGCDSLTRSSCRFDFLNELFSVGSLLDHATGIELLFKLFRSPVGILVDADGLAHELLIQKLDFLAPF